MKRGGGAKRKETISPQAAPNSNLGFDSIAKGLADFAVTVRLASGFCPSFGQVKFLELKTGNSNYRLKYTIRNQCLRNETFMLVHHSYHFLKEKA